jgi:peroxiredoxin
MGFLVDKSAIGFGLRSWRYAMIVNDKNIEVIFEEPGYGDECTEDPYLMTDPNTILNYLKEGLIPAAEKLQQE